MKRLLLALLLCLPLVGKAATPVVAGTATPYASTATGTSHTVNLPASIVSGDNLVLCLFYTGGTTTTITATGWTVRFNQARAAGAVLAVITRDADATEGATLGITLGASRSLISHGYRITGATAWATTAPVFGTAAEANSSAPDPPSVTPGGTDDYLYIECASILGAAVTVSTNGDTGFATTATTGGSPNHSSAIAYNGTTASTSYDAAAFGLSTPRDWISNAFAVTPAAAGGGVSDVFTGQDLAKGFGPHKSQQLGGLLD